jgi:putative oxidoreductase
MLNRKRRLDRKQAALVALWITLSIELGYVILAPLVWHASWGHLVQPSIFVLLFGLLAVARGRVRWVTTLLRLILSAEFGLSVADRFGWLGPPGHGAAWGDFAHFVTYTHQVNAFLPASFAPVLAVLATIFEATFAVALLLGIGLRQTSAGAALLLGLFGTAMVASGLVESQFFYAVFMLACGAWLISVTDASLLSVDQLIIRIYHKSQTSLHADKARA